jgi:hypothetical protein
MSSSNVSGQQAVSTTQQLINNTSVINRKVDELAATLEGLTLNEDIREMIQQQLQGIKTSEERVKLKALEHYDGKSRPLRSWLTEASLHMENKGITGDDARVRFIGGHLKGSAWDWFEPYARERNTKPKAEWSDRTMSVLASYKTLSKAMTQVFGDIDERKTAARKLQQLRQTSSVREYITEFQKITANLEWDEEALEDKFLEGLKPNIREALIFFTTDPDSLEELFERAQKIDREQWSGRTKHVTRFAGNRNKYSAIRKDWQGDVVMTGAKVNLEEARKTGACFKCGMKGHRANQCRQKTPRKSYELPSDGNRIRMVRLEESPQQITNQTMRHPGTESDGETEDKGTDTEGIEKEPLEVSALFQGLTENDFLSEESSDSAVTEAIDWERMQTQMKANEFSTEERERVQDWIDTHQNRINEKGLEMEETCQKSEDTGIQKIAMNQVGSLVEGHSSSRIQESPSFFRNDLLVNEDPFISAGDFTRKTARRLSAVEFSKLSRRKPVWKEFCEQRTMDTVKEYQDWYSRMYEKNRFCKCYGYNPECWARTGNTWMKHVNECEECENWSKQECRIPGHSSASKRTTLIDVSDRRWIPEVIEANDKTNCCENEICLHEFMEHGNIDVPWWACYNRNCAEHHAMKVRNRGSPELPTVTLLRNDYCPCFRKGCICGISSEHHFHRGLFTMKQCLNEQCNLHDMETTTVYDLDKEVAIFRKEIQKATDELRNFKETHKIRGIAGETPTRQMETTIRILGEDTEAIIDSGADINYVNKNWCRQKGIQYQITGYGKIRAYDDTYVQDYVRKATFEFRINGERQKQIFHVLNETGKDKVVLGMPWLESENPTIDWKKRTVVIPKKSRKSLSKGEGSYERRLAFRSEESRTSTNRNSALEKEVPRLTEIREEGPDSRRIGRATLTREDRAHPDTEGKESEEMKKIKKILPEELWEYKEVFDNSK